MGYSIILFAILYVSVAADVHYGVLEFSPRFMFGSVAKRQAIEDSTCLSPGYHTCLEVNSTSGQNSCCSNGSYCYLGPDGKTDCCTIGSDCDNQCTSSEVAIHHTATFRGSATSTFSCSTRSCPAASAFLCPSSLGGQCCSYGSTCGPSGGCTATINPATVIAPTATTCPTGQYSCPTAEGGGCCSKGSQCTASDSTLLCVITAARASDTASLTAIRTGPSGIIDANFTEISTSSSGLSSGAKAGIGVGSALGVVFVLGGIILFAKSRRRSQRYNAESGDRVANSETSVGEKRISPSSKNDTDYFGPIAKAGPFTERVTDLGSSPLGSPNSTTRGVPLSPEGPGDIAAPVEIGGREREAPSKPHGFQIPEKPEFRIELP